MFLLSTLKKGDYFKFLEGQKAIYLTNNNKFSQFDTSDINHIEYEVLKMNHKSIKVKPVDGMIEYVFKFKGDFISESLNGIDCVVEKIVPTKIEM